MTGGGASVGGQGGVVVLAALFLAALGAIEFGVYAPGRQRLQAAEKELESLRGQIGGAAHQKLADEDLLRMEGTGPDGAALRDRYGSEGGLVYLSRMIDSSRLSRVDFRTEASSRDGMFVVERFFVRLEGSFGRIFEFLKTLERSPRLVRVDEFRLEPVGTTDLLITFRASVYGLSAPGGTP